MPTARSRLILMGMVTPIAKLMPFLKPKRRWLQFSLGTGFLVLTALCVGLSLWVVPAQRQQRTVAAIEAMGGSVDYVPFLTLVQGSGVPDPRASEAFPVTYLRRWLPPHYFDEVLQVLLTNTRLTDAGLVHLRGLTSLETLGLDNTQGTDGGLAHLQGRTGLHQLWLAGSQVTDAGLAHLQGLTGLQHLSLGGTQVTDAGLIYLQGLTSLQGLSLANTQVTNNGARNSSQAWLVLKRP